MSKIIPKIIEQNQIILMGCNFYGDPFHSAGEWSKNNEIGKLWTRFGINYAKYRFLLEKLNNMPGKSFEVHFESPEYKQSKNFEIFVGIAVDELTNIVPLEFVFKILPVTNYASVTSYGNDYTSVDYLFKEWLKSPNSKYKQSYPFMVEFYDEKRFNPNDMDNPSSEIDWWVPVVEI